MDDGSVPFRRIFLRHSIGMSSSFDGMTPAALLAVFFLLIHIITFENRSQRLDDDFLESR